MKTTNEHFKIFHKHCEKWIKILGVEHWNIKIAGIWDDEDCDFQARTVFRNREMGATIWLGDEWNFCNKITDKDLDDTAKHEILHLLVAQLELVGMERWTSEEEVKEQAESLVNKLGKIIK